jgi:hypothetical protein
MVALWEAVTVVGFEEIVTVGGTAVDPPVALPVSNIDPCIPPHPVAILLATAAISSFHVSRQKSDRIVMIFTSLRVHRRRELENHRIVRWGTVTTVIRFEESLCPDLGQSSRVRGRQQ